MSAQPAFIAIDWGTSNARFSLVAADASLIDHRSGPGIGQLDGSRNIEQACFDNIGEWLSASPNVPVIMTGMVGSNIGWRVTEYVPTPARLDDLLSGLIRFEARGFKFLIVPGLATTRCDNLADVMRGEEVQVFGVDDRSDRILCLPGTHSKWVRTQNGQIANFHTALTGELLDLIGKHSILLNPKRPVKAAVGTDFIQGVQVARAAAAGLESLLFTVRSTQITGELQAREADSFLAGLAVGCEIKSAIALLDTPGSKITSVELVGSGHLTDLYATALNEFDISSQQHDGDQAALIGLFKLYQKMQTSEQ